MLLPVLKEAIDAVFRNPRFEETCEQLSTQTQATDWQGHGQMQLSLPSFAQSTRIWKKKNKGELVGCGCSVSTWRKIVKGFLPVK